MNYDAVFRPSPPGCKADEATGRSVARPSQVLR